MNAIIVGIGLIGGSMAMDLRRKYPAVSIYGVDANATHLEEAIRLGLIDGIADSKEFSEADIVVVSIPVDAIVKELPKLLDAIGDDSLVIDAGSTKSEICNIVEDHPKRRNFLACHPIAGTEFSGPSAAVSELFAGKTNIICEVEKTAFKLQERALSVFSSLGMRIRYMNPEAHDRHIAYVSHLSHISSFMLGKTVIEKEKNERDIFDMAGSGFESTVRLAKSSPAMWTPIFEQNLEDFKQKLIDDNYEGIYQEMDNTNKIKSILKGIPQNNKDR